MERADGAGFPDVCPSIGPRALGVAGTQATALFSLEFVEFWDDADPARGSIPYGCIEDYILQTGVFSASFPETISEGSSMVSLEQPLQAAASGDGVKVPGDSVAQPRLRLIVQRGKTGSHEFPDISIAEWDVVVKHFNLPVETLDLVEHQALYPGLTWRRLFSTKDSQILQQIICPEEGEMITLSSYLRARTSSGVILCGKNQDLSHAIKRLLETRITRLASSTGHTNELLCSSTKRIDRDLENSNPDLFERSYVEAKKILLQVATRSIPDLEETPPSTQHPHRFLSITITFRTVWHYTTRDYNASSEYFTGERERGPNEVWHDPPCHATKTRLSSDV
ncbi:hypothetical protein PVAG01_05557 [Phlyctema vagabunda]|uniref:Uncharacterized protein n=1 Tax=Phlyctema vagabunda TaxID=108571 RepID=A0ABR4PKE1_9HELO